MTNKRAELLANVELTLTFIESASAGIYHTGFF